MAVSKRTRFEVLKRDNHTCRYCGGVAPDVVLTIDHVVPVSLGGSDAPDNLVAACRDCNAGKGSAAPTDDLVAQVGEDDIRWADAIKRAAQAMLEEQQNHVIRHQWFLEAWHGWDSDYTSIPDGWAKSLDYWLGAGLPKEILLDCLNKAMLNRNVKNCEVFAYMGGIARSRIAELHEVARDLVKQEDGD